jgi:LysR family transcriptional regulator of abg operon
VTKSVRSLEAELEVQLLQRSSNGAVLTAAGRTFFARARIAQTELHKAREELAQHRDGDGGCVALGIGPASGISILPAAVVHFRDQYPRARIRITEGLAHVLWPLVRDGTLDLALALKPDLKREPALRFRPLSRMEFAVVARKGHPLLKARSLADLVDADWLSLLPPPAAGGPLDQPFSAAGLPGPRPVIECDTPAMMVSLLAKTDMLGTISRWLLAEPLVREVLQEIQVVEPMPSFSVGIVSRVEPPLTPLATALARAVTAAVRGLPGLKTA